VVAQPPPFIFFPRCDCLIAIEELLPRIISCDLIGCCSCTLEVEFSGVELCNSFLSVNVILNTKVLCIAFHMSRSVRPYELTI